MLNRKRKVPARYLSETDDEDVQSEVDESKDIDIDDGSPLQQQVNKKQKSNFGGSLSKKNANKMPPKNKPRPKLDIFKYNIAGWKRDMVLSGFLKIILKNKKVFLKHYKDVKPNERRKTLFDLLGLIELTYQNETPACETDIQCLTHLFTETNKYVTKNNVKVNLELLSRVYEEILYPQDNQGGAENSSRQRLIQALRSRTELVTSPAVEATFRTYFYMKEYRWELLHKKQEQQAGFKLNNVKLYPEYLLLRDVDGLQNILKTKPHTDRDWLPAAMTLIEASIGCRFVESLVVKFEVSTQSRFPSDLWIVQEGAVKDSSQTARNYNASLRKWIAKGNTAESYKPSDEEMKQLNIITDLVIPRPVLYREMGINPRYIIQLIKKVRKRVWEIYAAQNMWVPGVNDDEEDKLWLNLNFIVRDIASRREYTQKLIQQNSKFLRRFLGADSILLQDNMSHSFRKLYASYSYELMGSGTQQSYWFMNLLGHKNISASFNYMNLSVQMGLKSNQTDVSKLLEIIAANKTSFEKIKSEMNSMVQTNVKEKTALPGIEGESVYIKIDPMKYKHFDNDEEKKTSFEELYNDMTKADVDMFALTQKIMMSCGFQRSMWRYWNKFVLTPQLNLINEERKDKDQIMLKRRRKL